MASFSRDDSIYLFAYDRQYGYRNVDSVRSGSGYFLGLLSEQEFSLPGIPVGFLCSFLVPWVSWQDSLLGILLDLVFG